MLDSQISSRPFVLRQSLGPYYGLLIILFAVVILQILISIKIGNWSPLLATGIMWIFFAVVIFIGTRYKILLKDGVVVQKSFAKQDVAIPVAEITDICQEISDVSALVRFRRPFRRITIYHRDKFIDVSLKHFLTEDVNKLLALIQEQRPDLRNNQQKRQRKE